MINETVYKFNIVNTITAKDCTNWCLDQHFYKNYEFMYFFIFSLLALMLADLLYHNFGFFLKRDVEHDLLRKIYSVLFKFGYYINMMGVIYFLIFIK